MQSPLVLWFFSLFITAYSLALDQRSSCASPDVITVSQQVSNPQYFCAWYLSEGRTRSPIAKISTDALLRACRCISSVEPAGAQAKALTAIAEAARLHSIVDATCSSANPVRQQFMEPASFCTFFSSYPRHDSPIPNRNVPAVQQACKCVLSGLKPSSKTSSTRKVSSSTRKISSSTSKTSSSTIKTSSSTRILGSNSKLASSSIQSMVPSSKSTSVKISSEKASSSRMSTSGKSLSAESSSSMPSIARSLSSTRRLSSSVSRTTSPSKSSLVTVVSSSNAAVTSTPVHPSSGAGLGFILTRPTSLDSVALSYYNKMTSGLSYNSQGTIIGRLKQATLTSSVPAVTANPNDLSAQPSLQAQLQGVGLPSFDTTVSNVMAAIDAAFAGNSSSNSTGDFEDWVGSDSASNGTISKRAHHRHTKRFSFGDFLEGVDTYVCNDFVEGLCDEIEDACDIKDGAEAIYCLATGCFETAVPPAQYTFDNSYSFNLPSFSGGYVYKDAVSTLICNDCGMSVTNFRIQGTIVVDLTSATILASSMTISQDTVQRFNMKLETHGVATGSWSYVMSTQPLQSITASGVFTISPQILYAIGATWSTNDAASLSFGATSTLSDASAIFDPVKGEQRAGSNWSPNLEITQPTLIGSSAKLVPWIQSSIQISLQILGNNMPNALSINSQTSLGFANSYVTMAKLGHTKCGGGQLQSTSYQNIVNSANYAGGGSNIMYSSSSANTPVCEDSQDSPPSAAQIAALKAASGAGKFCSSFIGYVPPTVNSTLLLSAFHATSTATVTGSGTTTVTPSPVTTTVTVTSSVASRAQNLKRFVTVIRDSSNPERRGLIARRVIPTPIVVSTWTPQQVSAVCSSIATGVVQANVTSTKIISSGVTTSTVQGTVTAATPTATISSVVYVPATAPANQVNNSNIYYTPGTNSPWSYSGGANNYYRTLTFPKSVHHLEQGWVTYYFQYAQITDTGSFAQLLTGLEPGWTYNFTLNAGFDSTTDSCTVSYTLDGVPFESYSPTNTGTTSNLDNNVHPKTQFDGTYQVVPTAASQTLGISVSCAASGGFAAFDSVNFYGPLAD